MKFDTFGEEGLKKLLDGCSEWYSALKNGQEPRWLSILGPSGIGKTHCAARLWEWSKSKFEWHQFSFIHGKIYWPDFVQKLRSGSRFEMREEMKRWPVLFLDDIGSERDTTGFAAEELHTLLGCRMGKWTIITSNLGFSAVEALDSRIASRLIRDKNICIGVNAPDFSSRRME